MKRGMKKRNKNSNKSSRKNSKRNLMVLIIIIIVLLIVLFAVFYNSGSKNVNNKDGLPSYGLFGNIYNYFFGDGEYNVGVGENRGEDTNLYPNDDGYDELPPSDENFVSDEPSDQFDLGLDSVVVADTDICKSNKDYLNRIANNGGKFFGKFSDDCKKKVIIIFSATWCGPCNTMKTELSAVPAESFNGPVIFINSERYPTLAGVNYYNVQAYPTIVVISIEKEIKKGNEISRATGYHSFSQINALFN